MFRKLLKELHKRRVFRAAVSYLVVAWLIVQVISVIGPALGLTTMFMRHTLTVLTIGFPVAMLLSWFFAFSTHGVTREQNDDTAQTVDAGRSIDFVIIGVLATALLASFVYISTRQSSTPIPTEQHVLAVLPLSQLSASDTDNGFVDGLHDDLLNTLSQLSPLRVISRTSVLGFRDTQTPIPDIGRQLGANKIIEGSIQFVGDSIRVSIKLIDAATDSPMWAKSYERDFNASQLFILQRDIALAIASELKVALSLQEDERLIAVPTANTEAYRLYLLGRQRTAERTGEALEEAVEFFNRSIELDPQYGDAYAAMALAQTLRYYYGGLPLDTMVDIAMPQVQRALQLDPNHSDAHTLLAELRGLTGDPSGAESAFLKAIELNANNALARHWYGIYLNTAGRYSEALLQHKKALELDPLSPIIGATLAQDYTYLGDTESALAEYQRALEINPDFVPLYAHIAGLNRQSLRRPDESVRWLRKAWELDPGHTEYPSQMAESLLDLGQPDAARAWAEAAIAQSPDRYWPNRAMLKYAWFTGDRDLLATYSNAMQSVHASHGNSLLFHAEELINAGKAREAKALFLPQLAELVETPPRVTTGNYAHAVLLAYVLQANQEQQQATALLEASLKVMETQPRTGFNGVELFDVAAYALLNRPDEAIKQLHDARDSRWSHGWWVIRHQPLFETIKERPEVQQFDQFMQRKMDALHTSLTDEAVLPAR